LLWLTAVVNTVFVIGMVIYVVSALCSLGARSRVLPATPLLAGDDYI